MEDLSIIPDSNQGWFFPGQTVTGKVYVRTKKPVKARAIEITFVGKAKTSWSESESYRQ